MTNRQRQDEKEASCAVMIQGLLLWHRCHTLFNGCNELTRHAEPDTHTSVLTINQDVRAYVLLWLPNDLHRYVHTWILQIDSEISPSADGFIRKLGGKKQKSHLLS